VERSEYNQKSKHALLEALPKARCILANQVRSR
jgi:hypothetical protein